MVRAGARIPVAGRIYLPEMQRIPFHQGDGHPRRVVRLRARLSLAVLEREQKLPWPADVYHRRSRPVSRLVQLVIDGGSGRSRPSAVQDASSLTAGPSTAKARRCTNPLGNAVSPNEVANQAGAEILRLWVASSDFKEDVRLSEEILKRLVDTYRKLRNTARYALGNIFDFDPETDRVERAKCWRSIAGRLRPPMNWLAKSPKLTGVTITRRSTTRLYNYATVTLSSVYFDILKDRLYTFAPKSVGRRSAQTALYDILDKLARLVAPILAFTADEIWESIPGRREASVHLAEFPSVEEQAGDKELARLVGTSFWRRGRPCRRRLRRSAMRS